MAISFFRGRPSRSEAAAREDKVVASALNLFIEHGYYKTSLAMVAHAAHVAVRTIYVKFGGKHGLLLVVIGTGRARHLAQIGLLLDDAPQPSSQDELLVRVALLTWMSRCGAAPVTGTV